MLSRVLVEVFSAEGLRGALAFRGGTALNKLHLETPARYSEDIDLVQVMPGPIGEIINPMQHRLESLLGSASVSIRKRSARLVYGFESEVEPVVPLRLKIEIDTRDHESLFDLVEHPFEVRSGWFEARTELPTYHIDELMGTKLRALYQRRKGRDLFDHWLVLHEELVDPDEVVSCFQEYMARDGLSVSRAEFEENLYRKMESSAFLRDVRPLVRSDLTFDPEEAFRVVMEQLIAKLPGEAWRGRVD